jgi:hypothetical protein
MMRLSYHFLSNAYLFGSVGAFVRNDIGLGIGGSGFVYFSYALACVFKGWGNFFGCDFCVCSGFGLGNFGIGWSCFGSFGNFTLYRSGGLGCLGLELNPARELDFFTD